jgi:hypothetical protein
MRAIPFRSGPAIARVADAVPLSGRGLWIAALSAVALWLYGLQAHDLILLVAGAAGLGLVGLASACVSLAALALRARRDAPDASAPAGQHTLEVGVPARTGRALPGPGPLPLVQVRCRWLEPPGVDCGAIRSGGRWQERISARRRFAAQEVVRRFEVVDALGLASLAWQRWEPCSLVALPSPGGLRRAQLAASLSAADGFSHPAGAPEGDRLEIRPYVPGDSPRHILWKSFARSRRLDVRVPERSVALAQRVVAYLTTGPDDEPAAAAARVALESGALGGDWVFGADGSEGPSRSLPEAMLAIAGSSGAEPAPGALAGFVRRWAGPGCSCVVFAPARGGRWLDAVALALRERSVPLWLVLACEGPLVDSARPEPLWRRALLARSATAPVSHADLSALLARLPGVAGAWIAERGSGRVRRIDALGARGAAA